MRCHATILGLFIAVSYPSSTWGGPVPVTEIPNRSLQDIAAASFDPRLGPIIVYNPDVVISAGPQLSQFFFAHEYGHIYLRHITALTNNPNYRQAQEKAADCFAAQALHDNDAVLDTAVAFFRNIQGGQRADWYHPIGFDRAETIMECRHVSTDAGRIEIEQRLHAGVVKVIDAAIRDIRTLRGKEMASDGATDHKWQVTISLAGSTDCDITMRERKPSERHEVWQYSCGWQSDDGQAIRAIYDVLRDILVEHFPATVKDENADNKERNFEASNDRIDLDVSLNMARLKNHRYVTVLIFTASREAPPMTLDEAAFATRVKSWLADAPNELKNIKRAEIAGFDWCSAAKRGEDEVASDCSATLDGPHARNLADAAWRIIKDLLSAEWKLDESCNTAKHPCQTWSARTKQARVRVRVDRFAENSSVTVSFSVDLSSEQ